MVSILATKDGIPCQTCRRPHFRNLIENFGREDWGGTIPDAIRIEKESLYPNVAKWAMFEEVLDTYIRQYIAAHDAPVVNFAWQGGEPTASAPSIAF
jgi:hypothetical protein